MTDYTSYLKNLPIMPDVAARVIQLTSEGQTISFGDLEDVIKIDPGLATKVLKVANSSMYARQREISTLHSAISLLGFKNIRNLVVLITASALFKAEDSSQFLSYFWKQSIITAFCASQLADKLGRKSVSEEAFLAGLMANIGQVALYYSDRSAFETLYFKAIAQRQPAESLEEDYFGADHRVVGAALLGSWNFPDIFCDVAREKGQKNITSSHKQLIILVSLAEFMASNRVFYYGNPLRAEHMSHYLPYIGLTIPGLERLEAVVTQSLLSDDLYEEVRSIFGFE